MLLDAESILAAKALSRLEEGGLFKWRLSEIAICVYPLSALAVKAARAAEKVALQAKAGMSVADTGLPCSAWCCVYARARARACVRAP